MIESLFRFVIVSAIVVCFAGTMAIITGYGMGLAVGHQTDAIENASIEINESGYLVVLGEESEGKIIDILSDNYEGSDESLIRTPIDDWMVDRFNSSVNRAMILSIEMADQGARVSYSIGSPWGSLAGYPLVLFGLSLYPAYAWTGMHVRKMRA